MLGVLEKLNIAGDGPDTSNPIDKKTIVYQTVTTWIVEYDLNTNRCMQVTKTVEDHTY